MRLFQRETDDAEKSFRLFASDLKAKKFDLKVFDKRQIKKHLGPGLYKKWRESLRALRYRKIIIIFNEEELKISWPPNNYPDWLIVNLARAPDKEALLRAEKELLELLVLEKEIP